MVLTITLGADSLYTVYRAVETLEFSAILVFTGYDVTHVSILTSDTSTQPRGYASQAYGTLCYHMLTHVHSFGVWF